MFFPHWLKVVYPSRPWPGDDASTKERLSWLADHPRFPVSLANAAKLARDLDANRDGNSVCYRREIAAAIGHYAGRVGVTTADDILAGLYRQPGRRHPDLAEGARLMVAWGWVKPRRYRRLDWPWVVVETLHRMGGRP